MPAAIAALCVTAFADPLTVFFIDPGYDEYSGDAMLVRTPSGQAYLVDGGDAGQDPSWDCGESRVLPLLDSLGITHLDGIVASQERSGNERVAARQTGRVLLGASAVGAVAAVACFGVALLTAR